MQGNVQTALERPTQFLTSRLKEVLDWSRSIIFLMRHPGIWQLRVTSDPLPSSLLVVALALLHKELITSNIRSFHRWLNANPVRQSLFQSLAQFRSFLWISWRYFLGILYVEEMCYTATTNQKTCLSSAPTVRLSRRRRRYCFLSCVIGNSLALRCWFEYVHSWTC